MNKIVYVEDNINNQRLFARIMRKRNVELTIFDNPYTAHEKIPLLQPDMLFTDIELKTRDNGLALVRWLRADNLTFPIVAVTGLNMLADRHHAERAGCNGYISKPYRINELLDIMNTYLGAEV